MGGKRHVGLGAFAGSSRRWLRVGQLAGFVAWALSCFSAVEHAASGMFLQAVLAWA